MASSAKRWRVAKVTGVAEPSSMSSRLEPSLSEASKLSKMMSPKEAWPGSGSGSG